MTTNHRRRVVTSEEARLWRDVMRDVQPFPDRLLPEDAPAPLLPPPPSAPVKALPAPPAFRLPAPPPSAPRLEPGRAPGVDRNTADRLRKGAMAIEAVIDLHGLTQEIAHSALWRFVTGSAEQGRRCLLVITGKGSREGAGVLRSQVPRWLNEAPLRSLILAFTHAQPKHGGEGALYVLLKRRR